VLGWESYVTAGVAAPYVALKWHVRDETRRDLRVIPEEQPFNVCIAQDGPT